MDRSDINTVHFWVQVVWNGFLLLLGIVGNSLIIAFFGFKDKVFNTYKLFILLLAITDFMSCLTGVLFDWIPSYLLINGYTVILFVSIFQL